jgi:hypothetical protein
MGLQRRGTRDLDAEEQGGGENPQPLRHRPDGFTEGKASG